MARAADELRDSADRARESVLALLEAQSREVSETPVVDNHRYVVYKPQAGHDIPMGTFGTREEAEEAARAIGDGAYVQRFAKGTKNVTKDQVAWTQEQGPEMIISPSSGAILTPLKAGDAVIPADMTSNLWAWGNFNPEEFASKLLNSVSMANNGNVTANTMNISSLVTINGPVNDTVEMVKIAGQEAATKIKQSWNDFSNTLRG